MLSGIGRKMPEIESQEVECMDGKKKGIIAGIAAAVAVAAGAVCVFLKLRKD